MAFALFALENVEAKAIQGELLKIFDDASLLYANELSALEGFINHTDYSFSINCMILGRGMTSIFSAIG